MNIIFKKIEYKNLLGVGNAPVTIILDKNSCTLIAGKNGQGKSTVLEAISFVLFGTPFRKIKKGLLVNSINKKQCLVEIWFSIGTNNFRIKRGIKPDIFEIYKNDVKIEQSGSAIDHQHMLEETILHMNQKTFNQIVLLSTVHIKPFMQMEAKDRRDVIEDILDIRIFTEMNKVLKNRATALKETLSTIDGNIDVQRRKIELQQEYINTLKTDNNKKQKELYASIEDANKKIETLEKSLSFITESTNSLYDAVADATTVSNKKNKLSSLVSPMVSKVNQLKETIDFYTTNDTCPTCTQGISSDVKTAHVEKAESKIDEINVAVEKIRDQLNDLSTREKEIQNTNSLINQKNKEIQEINNQIIIEQNYIRRLNNELNSLTTSNGSIDNEAKTLVQYEEAIKNLIRQKAELTEKKQNFEIAATLLKDSGIKTQIIDQYIPVVNKLINHYLTSMDTWISFHLDSEFNETIKSRHRDDFTYFSFSEGEKQRIDLAIIFTWRMIAKMKNSVSCNILFFDEVLDKALDDEGVDYIIQLLETLGENTNVFVITPKYKILQDKFKHMIMFEKINNFSCIVNN